MALMSFTSKLSSYKLLVQAASRHAPVLFAAALPRMSTRARAVPAVAGPPEGEYDENEDYDPMADLTATQKRRVLALKDVQTKYDDINKDYQKEVAQLQAKYQERFTPLFDERKAIVSGTQAVGTFDVPDDGEPDSGVKDFWLVALQNHDKVSPYISERDAEVLAYLQDIRSEVLTGEERGFKLTYHFGANPFFANKVLTKTYVLMPEDDIVPKEFIGCKIDWKAGKDVTVEQVKKRVKGGKGEDKKNKAFVTETVPCDSFFNTFDPPKVPVDNTAMSDEALDELQEELTIDFDIGFAIKDSIIPRAVEWFTGEIAPYPEEDEYYDEDEEAAEAPPPPPTPSRRR